MALGVLWLPGAEGAEVWRREVDRKLETFSCKKKKS